MKTSERADRPTNLRTPAACRHWAARLVLLCAAWWLALTAHAQTTRAWIGGTGPYISTPANWVGGVVPAQFDPLSFGSAVVNGTVSNDVFNIKGHITLSNALTLNITFNGPQPLILEADDLIDMSSAGANLTISPAYWLWANATWNIGAGRTLLVNGAIAENSAGRTNGITKTGAGTAILAGANAYQNTTTISGGVLQIGNNGTTGGLGYSNVVDNASLVFCRSYPGYTVTNVISGTGSVTLNYTAAYDAIKIGGNNTYSGGTYINNGGLWLYPGAALGSGPVTITNTANLKIQASSAMTLANDFVLSSLGNGQTTAGINQDGGGGLVTLNGGITLAGNSRIGVGGASWNSTVINGQITGPGKLYVYESTNAVAGLTTLTLTSGANNWSGGTEIENGELLLAAGGSLGSGPVAVKTNATLSGAGTIAGAVMVAAGGTIAPGSGGVGTLTINNSLTLAGSTLAYDITSAASGDKIMVAGDLTPSGVTTIRLSTSPALTNGDYTLIEVTGTLGGSAANFSVASPSVTNPYTIVYQAGSPNKVVLHTVTLNPVLTPAVAPSGYVEVEGVGTGAFNPNFWQAGHPNLVPDYRFPLLTPLPGKFTNIYAPSAVETPTGYRLFYGAWDGISTGNDHIYSLTTDWEYQDFANRHQVVQPGSYTHICNVNALRFDDGSYAMFGTLYPVPLGGTLNKPAFFRSDTTGTNWNGGTGEPYTAVAGDVVSVTGYSNSANANINGMNVMLFENGVYRLYFGDLSNFIGVQRASSVDGKNYTYDGQVMSTAGYMANDVKTFLAGGVTNYLMGLHINGDRLFYALSTNGLQFPAPSTLLSYQNVNSDQYIVSMGWVVSGGQGTSGRKLMGVLYGAGAVGTLDKNKIYARWFQKKVVFAADNGTRYSGTNSFGPDRQLLSLPAGQTSGHFEYYAEDGVTLIGVSGALAVSQGQTYRLLVDVVPIPKLFNTGVSAAGGLLGTNTIDPHYILIASADASHRGPAAVTVNAVWPLAPAGPWLINGPDSAWIAPSADQGAGNAPGQYTYRTTFDLTGYDPTTANIAGNVAVDDILTDVQLNGSNLGAVAAGDGAFTEFTIAGGSASFVAGTNTLDFLLINAGSANNPTGLRVEMVGSVKVPVPVLSWQVSGNNMLLSWPLSSSGGYALFSATSLAPVAWAQYAGAMTTNNGQITVSVSVNGTSRFFRLQN